MNDASKPAKDPNPPFMRELALACAASAGHFSELRGVTQAGAANGGSNAINSIASQAQLTGDWNQFFACCWDTGATDLNQRLHSLARQIHDNGVTYNVYADEGRPQRPWALDLFPLILDPESWQHIEQGVLQRMRLLEGVMADVYGSQQLLEKGLVPPALVQGHPGYLRAMHGVSPVGGTRLHVAAFDLGRGPDGLWRLLSQRCQAPSGLGYLLENRLAISGQFGQAFQSLRVQRLAGTYRALMESLRQMSPAGANSHLALLSPGPYNESYFEHAYLARYLGLTLVEGSDLTVRDEHLYLKTIKGLVPIHALLNRVNDQYLDPLELRADSMLGVPGLLQVIRAGHLLMANAPGSAFLESPALLGFLPAIARELLGEELMLPALATWWCGERAALQSVLPRLGDSAIKSTYPASAGDDGFDSVLGRKLSQPALDAWLARMNQHGEKHTVQAYLPLSQMPTWQVTDRGVGAMIMQSVVLRVFAVADGVQSWRVLPGGLARVAGINSEIATMQRGGSSADVWALTRGAVDSTTLLQPHLTPAAVAQHKRLVTSRSAENLFWLGRYTERAENAITLARLTLECLNGDDQSSPALLAWLSKMAVINTLVLPGVPAATQDRRVFERSLIASLGSTKGATSVGYSLRALKMTASMVRERLSQEHWRVIVRAEEELFARCAEHAQTAEFSPLQALQLLKSTSLHMAAITGAQTDRMTRDDGWRLLSIGRHIERLGFLASALTCGFETQAVHTAGGFDAMIALFDSTITFHAQYQQSRDLAALLELLVLDRDNPRSLAWVAHTLRGRIAKLSGSAPDELCELSLRIPAPSAWGLEQLCEAQPNHQAAGVMPGTQASSTHAEAGYYYALNDLLLQCENAAFQMSEQISTTYFTHSGDAKRSVGV